ncbi:hypothetical protein M3Y96_00051600 [Aphelenchoides besseyi]|nr:hypothetical protein M3Y96_00051600 [Aphelenchoides besseyi]
MLAQTPLLLHLTSSFLISTLRLHIEPENVNQQNDSTIQTPFILISPNRNISFTLRGSTVLADGLPLMSTDHSSPLASLSTPITNGVATVTARCQHGYAIRLNVNEFERTIPSPSFCANHGMNEILIGPDDREHEAFYGCIRNVTLGPNQILSSWCRLKSTTSRYVEELRSSTLSEVVPSMDPDIQVVYVGERLRCAENKTVRVQWKNLYLFPEHRRYRSIQYEDIRFHVIDGPSHGEILLNGTSISDFTYDDLIKQRLAYAHDGSETSEDSADFKVWIEDQTNRFPFTLNPQTITLPIQIDPIDDLPQLMLGPEGARMNVTPSSRVQLTSRHLKVWDVDTPTHDVYIEIQKQEGAYLCTKDGTKITRFTLAQYLNGNVFVESEGGHGHIQLYPRANPSAVVTLRLLSTSISLRIQNNTGIKIPHRSNRLISSTNLTVLSNFPDLPVNYAIVDSAEFGLVECLRTIPTGSIEEFQICSEFTQQDIDQYRVRYRHTAESRPSSDSFSFYAQSGDQRTAIHQFSVDFVPISVRIFIEESLFLNNTQQSLLTRRNLLATAFPISIPTDQLVFHVVEPPKFGMLQRQVDGGRMRRIGLSSNFTQQHIDDMTVLYKLHFTHFAVLNDFFTFRVVTPAVASELMRFDITFIPGGNALQLINRTLIVDEGKSQQITNRTLWLETADDSNFVFTLALEPLYGNLTLKNDREVRTDLAPGSSFSSFDLLNGRIDILVKSRVLIVFFCKPKVRVIPDNDQAPKLASPFVVSIGQPLTIHVREYGERVLYSSLLPWHDPDRMTSEPVLHFFFPELFREFTISRRQSPEIPVRNFTNIDLRDRVLLLRHVGLKTEATQRYLVSDEKHTVQSEIRFMAFVDQFVRLSRSVAPTIRVGTPIDGVIPVQPSHLWAETNLDMDPNAIRFAVSDSSQSPFRILNSDGRLQITNSFTQSAIGSRRVFYIPFVEPKLIKLTIWALHFNSEVTFRIEPTDDVNPLQLRFVERINLPQTATVTLDAAIWRVNGGDQRPILFVLDRIPNHGSVILVRSAVSNSAVHPMAWRLENLRNGQLRYVHHGGSGAPNNDSFTFNITINEQEEAYGPFRLDIHLAPSTRPVLLIVRNLTLPWGAATVVNASHLRTLIPTTETSNIADTRYVVTQLPNAGRLLVNGAQLQPNGHFTHGELQNGRVVFTASGKQTPSTTLRPTSTSIRLQACERHGCSEEMTIYIRIEADNLQAPELLRNEPLFMVARQAVVITSRHLHAADSDTATGDLRFLIWQPSGGYIAYVQNQSEPLISFTQSDINEGRVMFILSKTHNFTEHVGFSFLVTDGIHQTRPEWFVVEKGRDQSVEIDANVRLNAAPGVLTPIGIESLRARLIDVPAHEVVFRITRPPTHGKIVHENFGNRAVENFTQADIDALRISYAASTNELGSWSVRDHFNFVVLNAKGDPNAITSQNEGALDHENDFRFRILLSYAFVDTERLNEFATLRQLTLTRGGSLMLNSTFVNVTRLSELCDDVLLIEVEKPPMHGTLEFLSVSTSTDMSEEENGDDDQDRVAVASATTNGITVPSRVITSEELHSGRHLAYRHNGGLAVEDEFTLTVYSLRERNRRSVRLRLPISVKVEKQRSNVEVERFRSTLELVSSGSTTLLPADFMAIDRNNKQSDVTYEVIQRASNGVRLAMNGTNKEVETFGQHQIDAGHIRLEHTPLSADDKHDVIVMRVGGHLRVLLIRIEPLALQLFNYTPITYVQGRTFVLLDRKHLGANSNGDRNRIIYNITRPPENGSLYWVAGEKEAHMFTQKNIDDGDVLYAQLNLDAFGDAFDFIVNNDDMELLQKSEQIIVLPPFKIEPLLVESRSVAQISSSHLNASALEGAAPRFLIVKPPIFGRFFIYPDVNTTINFFTYAHILDGRLFFQSAELHDPLNDNTTLELRADDVQPSRFVWPIRIAALSDEDRSKLGHPSGLPRDQNKPRLPEPPELNFRFPIGILVIVVASVIGFLLCRKSQSDKKKQLGDDTIVNIGTRELPELDDEPQPQRKSAALQPGPLRRGNDLLDSTVYASESIKRRPLPILQSHDPLQTSTRQKATTFETTETPRPLNRPPFGPAYKSTALSAVTQASARLPPSGRPTGRLNDNQYWV